jgi:hypothetical protein
MDNNSVSVWQRIQTRMDKRFGKYFKEDAEQTEHKSSDGQSHQNVNAYKIKFIVSHLTENNDD